MQIFFACFCRSTAVSLLTALSLGTAVSSKNKNPTDRHKPAAPPLGVREYIILSPKARLNSIPLKVMHESAGVRWLPGVYRCVAAHAGCARQLFRRGIRWARVCKSRECAGPRTLLYLHKEVQRVCRGLLEG
ncbi:hypothetical protein V1511DRAFT_503005 [Dipodascopsis uninucleata]